MSFLPLFNPGPGRFFIALLLFSVCGSAQHVKSGVATWVDNNRVENTNNFYALHKYVPIGTIIKVRNPMNNRTINVMVVGKLPDNEENKGVIIKLSGAVARYLNMLDIKVRVELTMPEEARRLMASNEMTAFGFNSFERFARIMKVYSC